VYIAFFTFVVMNTLTSLFLEATLENADNDVNMIVSEELKRKSEYMHRAEQLFEFMDQDSSGDVSAEELERLLHNPQMIAFASSLELDLVDIAQFYKVLSCNGKYRVDAETFVAGCLKLKGPARSLDLQALIVTQNRACRTLEALAESWNRSADVFRETRAPRQTIPDSHESTLPSEIAKGAVLRFWMEQLTTRKKTIAEQKM